jgi:hypothetical protein
MASPGEKYFKSGIYPAPRCTTVVSDGVRYYQNIPPMGGDHGGRISADRSLHRLHRAS